MMGETKQRAFWVWVTRPEYYYDAGGVPREDLDPAVSPGGPGGWWTCHEETKAGDLVLLYRTAPESDVAYVLEAGSNARLLTVRRDYDSWWDGLGDLASEADSVADSGDLVGDSFTSFVDEFEDMSQLRQEIIAHQDRLRRDPSYADSLDEFGDDNPDADLLEMRIIDFRSWLADLLDIDYPVFDTAEFSGGSYVCDWRPRYKFDKPLKLAALRGNPWLAKNWNALRADFNQRAYRTTPEVWSRLIDLADRSGNPDLKPMMRDIGDVGPSADIRTEKALEDALAADMSAIVGYDLKLYTDGAGRTGRQFNTSVGLIDLLAMDRMSGGYVVVELKAVMATRDAIGQVMAYVGWVSENLAEGKPVEALVISDGVHAMFASAAAAIPNLSQIDIAKLGLTRRVAGDNRQP